VLITSVGYDEMMKNHSNDFLNVTQSVGQGGVKNINT
jgi:hypothetical protein